MKSKQKIKKEVKFKAREGSRITDNEAEVYGKHILSIMKVKEIHMVTSKDILNDAKKKNTPYHEYFNWDDSLAAEEYRINQARQLIGSIMQVTIIHEEEEPQEIRCFVNVIDEKGERGYVKTAYAMTKPILMNQVVQQALKEVESWRKRYKEYQELGKIHRAIVETEEELNI